MAANTYTLAFDTRAKFVVKHTSLVEYQTSETRDVYTDIAVLQQGGHTQFYRMDKNYWLMDDQCIIADECDKFWLEDLKKMFLLYNLYPQYSFSDDVKVESGLQFHGYDLDDLNSFASIIVKKNDRHVCTLLHEGFTGMWVVLTPMSNNWTFVSKKEA